MSERMKDRLVFVLSFIVTFIIVSGVASIVLHKENTEGNINSRLSKIESSMVRVESQIKSAGQKELLDEIDKLVRENQRLEDIIADQARQLQEFDTICN